MPRGGSKPGERRGGRKAGTLNKANAEMRATIAASGLMPLDFMLSVLRNEANDQTTRMDAAYKAAPYVHPKLVSTDNVHKGPDGDSIAPIVNITRGA